MKHRHTYSDHAPPKAVGTTRDPVCGMLVDPHTIQHKSEHSGRSWFFYSAGCREEFLAEPERFIEAGALSQALRRHCP